MTTTISSITLFGASGKTGQAVLNEAAVRGIKVQEVARNFTDDFFRKSIKGCDAVVIVFGPRPPYTDIFCAKTTKQIIRAMKAVHVHRLICQTGAMIGDYHQNRSFIFELFSSRFHRNNPEGYNDRVQQEKAIMTSSLEWTVIKPPRLTDSQDNAPVHAGENIKVGLLSSVSRKSLARFILDVLHTRQYMRKIVFVKN